MKKLAIYTPHAQYQRDIVHVDLQGQTLHTIYETVWKIEHTTKYLICKLLSRKLNLNKDQKKITIISNILKFNIKKFKEFRYCKF